MCMAVPLRFLQCLPYFTANIICYSFGIAGFGSKINDQNVRFCFEFEHNIAIAVVPHGCAFFYRIPFFLCAVKAHSCNVAVSDKVISDRRNTCGNYKFGHNTSSESGLCNR